MVGIQSDRWSIAERQEDWTKTRWRDRTSRAADRNGQRGSPDRHALLVAGQAVGIGRRHGDSKCLWH